MTGGIDAQAPNETVLHHQYVKYSTKFHIKFHLVINNFEFVLAGRTTLL